MADLFVRRLGDPALPPLIVIHGGPTWDHSYLVPAVEPLADIAHIVLFDLRGCGRSSRIPPIGDLPVEALQPDLLADDVAALITGLGTGPADVLGFSYGGMIAMRTVAQHPGVVRSAILASTSAYRDFSRDDSPDHRHRRTLSAPIDPALYRPDAPDGALSRAMAVASAPLDLWNLDLLPHWLQLIDAVRFSSDWNAPYAAGTLRPGAPDDPDSALRDWGGPVLLLQGEREMTFPIGLARRLHAAVPGSTLVEVPDAAHVAFLDNPAVWTGAIRDFLTGQAGRRPR
ncbi:alpha/beta fold hydrolase [Actinoplanes couchii]|uniref:Amino acid amidase n=1 Tax=Actinoplanes couchii TaxID=403638 RepID=A0ABQ3XR91_9ACTN|nr:alpha/beta hydrolase [Actinoplanes couchii]MDR6319992.1 pimeloyl-ACP methyl ester carboxylesterase [Actinoplanes couchii]GID61032.1 amino acid amidase [Actinoplanes couchii]